jgi:hypothetical protein
MDDASDRGNPRAPELEDLLNLCAALRREEVHYVLIGGFAVILHGWVRATKDIDLLVDVSVPNVQALKRALRPRHGRGGRSSPRDAMDVRFLLRRAGGPIFAARLLAPLLMGRLRRFHPIHARTIASAMVGAARAGGAGRQVYMFDDIVRLAGTPAVG